ncbi:MAG TPA: metallophosphoesterase [Gaiellaceae bacterium]|nr:metallophosphoesterase [Gaiellaceae bacterium]
MRFAAVLLGVLAALLPAAGQARAEEPVRIIAFGDFGVGGDHQRSFAEGVRKFEARNRADLLVTLGDNDYTESPAAFRANWESSYGWWTRRRQVAVAGVLGNHDVKVEGGTYQFRSLSMPGRYYRRRLGPVELFLLDSNRIDARQTSWLARALRASGARWKIAVFHHPAFACGGYRSHPEVVARWLPLFERHRVVLALSGHDHNYQRFAPRRGVRHVVQGGAASNLYAPQACPAGYPRRLRALREHGFLYLSIRSGRLDGWAVWPDGRRRDHFVLRG